MIPTSYTPPSLEALRAMTVNERGQELLRFVNSKDPAEEYAISSLTDCAIGQFAKVMGMQKAGASGHSMRTIVRDENGITVDRITLLHHDGHSSPIYALPTFGTLARRLETYLAATAHLPDHD